MSCLLIDTAISGTTVGVCSSEEEGKIIARSRNEEIYGQGDALVPMVEAVLLQAGIGYADLKKIAVVKGPGTYTGLRAGLACAKMLRQVLGVRAIGICSFDAILKTYEIAGGDIKDVLPVVVLDTKRRDYYVKICNGSAAQVMSKEVLLQNLESKQGKSVVILGNIVNGIEELHEIYNCVEILNPTLEALSFFIHSSDSDLSPVYLRQADVTL